MRKMYGLFAVSLMIMLFLFAMAACSSDKESVSGEPEAGSGISAEDESASYDEESVNDAEPSEQTETEEGEFTMNMMINDTPVKVAWENNGSVKALAELAADGPVTIEMSPYGGFEQVGSIGADLPSNDTNINTKAGDIMLYMGNQMVIFHGSNSWAYTRLGKITDKSSAELKKLLGGEGVTVKLSAE